MAFFGNHEDHYRSVPDLPSFTSRLQDLTPSRNVVDFYDFKIKTCEEQLNKLMEFLEEYKLSHDHQLNLERRVRQVMDQNENLRQSLTAIQSQLFEERQSIMQLKAENGQLKLQELSDRAKICHLLTLPGIFDNVDGEALTLFLKSGFPLEDIPEIQVHVSDNKVAPDTRNFALQTENDILQLKVTALQAELAEKTELALQEHDAFVDERRQILCDFELRKANDTSLIEDLTQRFKKLQASLHNQLKNYITSRKATSMPDFNEMQIEKPTCPKKVPTARQPSPQIAAKEFLVAENTNLAKELNHGSDVKDLTSQLKKSEASRRRQEKLIHDLQAEISRLKKQKLGSDDGPDKYKQLTERIQILSSRNKGLERRRKLDYEGFRSDVKLLRDQLRDIEKQLLKIVVALGKSTQKISIDMSELEAIESTTREASQIATKLNDLTSKLVEM